MIIDFYDMLGDVFMKKIMSIFLIFLLTMIFTLNSFATTDYFIPYGIQEYIDTAFDNYEIKDKIPLYDLDDNVTAYMITLSPVGYIIYNHDEIIESSHTLDYQITKQKIYYCGPLSMFELQGDCAYRNLISSEVSNFSELQLLEQSFKSLSLKEDTDLKSTFFAEDSIVPCTVSNYKLPYLPRTYSYNPDGRCGSVALAITLMYYDDHIDSNVVPSWISSADNTGEYFSTLLKPHVEDIDSSYGSTTSELQRGANWYFSYRGINSQYSATALYNTTFSRYRAIIDTNRPVIVDLNAHPTYKEHWVVGYGYYYQSSGSAERCLIIANDGWGNNGREISYKYVGDLVFFNK